jgi:hypothetical protein
MRHPPQEADLIRGGAVTGVAIGVVLATILGVWVAWGIGSCTTRELGGRWARAGTAGERVPPEVNAIETGTFRAQAQGIELNRRTEAYLSTYGWVDRNRGIVHVPLDVAFDLYLARQGGAP